MTASSWQVVLHNPPAYDARHEHRVSQGSTWSIAVRRDDGGDPGANAISNVRLVCEAPQRQHHTITLTPTGTSYSSSTGRVYNYLLAYPSALSGLRDNLHPRFDTALTDVWSEARLAVRFA